jgi:nucleotide-binding universal stress UspA family protein
MSSIHNILVPIDFSEHSEKALEFAISLAKGLGARLELLHCYPINPGGISPYGIVIPENLDREMRDAASARMSEWREKAVSAGIDTDLTLTPAFPSEAISATAEEHGADLIVMGTRGLTGLGHILLGSVAERTLRIAPCPVVTVKQDAGDE